MDYACIIYHGFNIHGTGSDQKRIQLLQNMCIRFATQTNRFNRISPILNEMNTLNTFNRRQYLICCIIHKIINKNSAPYLNDILTINKNKTRLGEDTISLLIKKISKVKDEHILAHSASKLWNKIPNEIRNIVNHNIFRNKLFKYLIEYQKQNQN